MLLKYSSVSCSSAMNSFVTLSASSSTKDIDLLSVSKSKYWLMDLSNELAVASKRETAKLSLRSDSKSSIKSSFVRLKLIKYCLNKSWLNLPSTWKASNFESSVSINVSGISAFKSSKKFINVYFSIIELFVRLETISIIAGSEKFKPSPNCDRRFSSTWVFARKYSDCEML